MLCEVDGPLRRLIRTDVLTVEITVTDDVLKVPDAVITSGALYKTAKRIINITVAFASIFKIISIPKKFGIVYHENVLIAIFFTTRVVQHACYLPRAIT